MISSEHRYRATLLFGLLWAALLGGCATGGDPRDPLEPLNRSVYRFNEVVDKAVLKPAAKSYDAGVPKPVKTAVGNFFSNVDDVLVTFNDLLQLKIRQAASDAGRVLVNSTAGILGFVDVATSLGLAKHDEDFGQTLGYWGVGNGPYLVLPFFGPSTVRDTTGLAVDLKLDPLINGIKDVPTRNAVLGLRVVNKRFSLLGAEKIIQEAALDPYEFLRETYLQRRRSQVYDGNPPKEKEEDEEDDQGGARGKRSSSEPARQEADTQASAPAFPDRPVAGEPEPSAPAIQRIGAAQR